MRSFTLAHAWNTPGDLAALHCCREALRAHGIDLRDAAGGAADALKMHGMPLREARAQGTLLHDLRQAALERGWAASLPGFVQTFMRQGGSWFGIPVGVHESNWMWLNASCARDAGPPPGAGDIARWLRAARRRVPAPLAVGAEPWQLGVLFESLVLAYAGADAYRAVFEQLDPAAWRQPALGRAVAAFLALREFADESTFGLDWRLQLERVRTGEAAMLFMGDWVRVDGSGLLGQRIPGVREAITVVDFLAPLAGADPQLAHETACVLTDPALQHRLAAAKGCSPAIGRRAAPAVPSVALEQSCAGAARVRLLDAAASHFVRGAAPRDCLAALEAAWPVQTLLVERSN